MRLFDLQFTSLDMGHVLGLAYGLRSILNLNIAETECWKRYTNKKESLYLGRVKLEGQDHAVKLQARVEHQEKIFGTIKSEWERIQLWAWDNSHFIGSTEFTYFPCKGRCGIVASAPTASVAPFLLACCPLRTS